MSLACLHVDRLRNLTGVQLALHPRFNVFFGENGSGKTSLLEAIHHLSVGRSFRLRGSRAIIQHDHPQFTVFGEVLVPQGGPIAVGVARYRNGKRQLKRAGAAVSGINVLAAQLPLQVIYSDTLRYLVGEPKWRRRFVDWGAFHVEPAFYDAWRAYQTGLKQRNSVLQSAAEGAASVAHVSGWDKVLSEYGETIDRYRAAYVAVFIPAFQAVWAEVVPDVPVELIYYRGWEEAQTLWVALQSHWTQDMKWGYTRVGPHRADFFAYVQGYPAHHVLSQGQQKLLVYALMLTQALLLQTQYQKPSVLLLDDLPAELDAEKRWRIMKIIARLEGQVFITGVHHHDLMDTLRDVPEEEVGWFHVEQGRVTRK